MMEKISMLFRYPHWLGCVVVGIALIICNIGGAVSFCDNSARFSHGHDDCGVTQEIPGDLRTEIPWTAAIFLKSRLSPNYTYHATGVILSPTTVMTVFAGVHGKLPRKIRGKYSIHNPEFTLVAAGLNSANLSLADEHARFAEVSFVEPYMGPEEPNKEYHFVLLHLKTPLDFETPYVRSICLPYTRLGQRKNDSMYLHGGFSKRKIKNENGTDWDIELKIQNVTTGTGYECVKNFEHFYERHFPAGMFCAKHPQAFLLWPPQFIRILYGLAVKKLVRRDDAPTDASFSCLLHGSAVVQKLGRRRFLSGLTALIRGRRAGMCKHDSIYFNTKLATSLDWIQRSLRCSPFSFSCTDGTCLPLEDVCNSVKNCLDGSDENEIFCEANNRCDTKYKTHQCSLMGKCISKDELCDGKPDCDDGNDESPLLCDKELSTRNMRDTLPWTLKTYCLPIPESEGVQIEYIHPNHNVAINCSMIPVNTVVTLSCKSYYKPTFLYSNLELQCNDHGKWSTYSPFTCVPDCGIINHKPPSINEVVVTVGTQYTLPWHALLFRSDGHGQYNYSCGATLVEQSYLITAADCISSEDGTISSSRVFKIVFAAVSKNYSLNIEADTGSRIFNIDNIWRHEFYNTTNKQFNIAIMKLLRPIRYDAFVRPACYLPSDDVYMRNKISIKTSDHHSDGLAGLHVADFPKIAEMICMTRDLSNSRHLTTKCAGQINGVPVHQKDMGGGLVHLGRTKYGTRYILQGIMSFEEKLGPELISFFTTLEKSRGWILSVLNKQHYYS